MTPRERYRDEIDRGGLLPDPAQAALVEELERIHRSLATARDAGLLSRLARRLGLGSREPVRGLYAWGGVGRGKTRLVDLFASAPRLDPTLRIHFHRFMQHVHGELKALPAREDPLRFVAGRLAARARVLCLDEFHVCDITDAMILARLLDTLFERGVTLVATSNTEPSRLYAEGLQRDRFLPAIGLIERHTTVLRLDGGTDYRLRALERVRTYHTPLGPEAERGLAECFRALAPGSSVGCGPDTGSGPDAALEFGSVAGCGPDAGSGAAPGPGDVPESGTAPGSGPGTESGSAGGATLVILGRAVPVIRHAEGIAWFAFADLCGGPRSTPDYIEIARSFHTVALSGVPVLDDDRLDPLRRFIHLVDELYDRNVNLLLSAAAAPEGLYRGRKLIEPFRRTRSRLVEMQSRAYLGRGHVP